jgi:hypothetical protein
MTRRPTGSVEAALATVQTWMQETRRVVEALREEVEELRLERLELQAQLRFTTDQANREVMAAAKMKEQLDSVRGLQTIPDDSFSSDEKTQVDPVDIGTARRRQRADQTERQFSTGRIRLSP